MAEHTVQLTDDDLRLIHSALHSYLDDFGHEEADVLRQIKRLIAKLPDLPEGDHWISDPATDRFGLIAFSGSLAAIGKIRDLIGKDPEIGEEFELEN